MWPGEADTVFAIVSGDITEHMFTVEPSENADVLYFYIEQFLDTAECVECAAETFDVDEAVKIAHNELKGRIIEHGEISNDVYQ
jgi:Zn ribbon nucleic-acid-binding protein